MSNRPVPKNVNYHRMSTAVLLGGERVRLADWSCQRCGRLFRPVDFKISEQRIDLICPDDGVDALNIELR